MIKNRLSGTLWPIFWLLICVYFVYSGIKPVFYTFQEEIQEFISEGKVYGNIEKHDEGAIKVLDISATNIRVDDQIFYIVETNDRLVLLESNKNDEDLKYILDNKYNLEQKDYYLAVEVVPESERKGSRGSRRTVYNITPEFIRAVEDDIEYNFEVNKMKERGKELVTFEYVSLKKYKESIDGGFWMALIFSLIGLAVAYYIYRKIKTNIREYKELENFYPELVGDFAAIRDYAEFKDEKLKIIIYKDGLIAYYKGFSITRLSDVGSIEVLETVTRGKGKRYEYHINISYLDKKEEIWRVKKYKGETIERLRKFKGFITKNYPDLKIKIISN